MESLEHKSKSRDPDRISRLYAMLQSTDKGAQRAHKNSQNFFNERIKMSNDQSNRLN